MSANLKQLETNEQITIEISTGIDISSSSFLLAEAKSVIKKKKPVVIFLKNIESMDFAGFQAICAITNEFSKKGVPLSIEGDIEEYESIKKVIGLNNEKIEQPKL